MPGDRRQLPFDFAHDPDYGAASFIDAACNRAARAWIDRWPEWPGPGLALHGPSGCGKTHLGTIWQERASAIALAPASLAPDAVPQLLGDAKAALIDGTDERALSPTEERGLLHLYNLVAERGGHLLLLSRTPPARWSLSLPDLRSRLSALPAVPIDAPDDELLRAVLVKLFADRQLDASMDAIAYLLLRMPRSFEAARRLVAELDRRALASGRRVTTALARETMSELDSTAELGEGEDHFGATGA